MDNDERKDKTLSILSTMKSLRQGNINKLTQKTETEGSRRKHAGFALDIEQAHNRDPSRGLRQLHLACDNYRVHRLHQEDILK